MTTTDRKLPVIPEGYSAHQYATMPGWFLRDEDGYTVVAEDAQTLRAAADWLEAANNIPRSQAADELVRCRECEHWRPNASLSLYQCDSENGLKRPLDNGSDYCRYAERKARGE